MKAEYDFSKGERGKFYQPKAVFNLPIYLEEDVDEFIRKLAVRIEIGCRYSCTPAECYVWKLSKL